MSSTVANLKSWAAGIYRRQRSALIERRDNRLTRVAEQVVRLVWKHPERALERMCYFSSYDPDGVVDEYVFHYLNELKKNGFGIIFVTTSPNITATDLDRLRKVTRAIILRKNLGHDFYSWKVGLESCPPERGTARVLLANDSVYGPLYALDACLQRMERLDLDVAGMTDSWELGYHVQSYFLYCRASVVESGFLDRFFGGVKVVSNKKTLVKRYELGFTRMLEQEGFRVGALIDYRWLFSTYYESAKADNRERVENPCIFFWKELVTFSLVPFVKKGIFALEGSNPVLLLRILERAMRETNAKLSFVVVKDNLQRTLSRAKVGLLGRYRQRG